MTSILWRKYYSHAETENIVKSVLFNYGQGKPIVAIQVGLIGPCVRFNILFAKKCGGIKVTTNMAARVLLVNVRHH